MAHAKQPEIDEATQQMDRLRALFTEVHKHINIIQRNVDYMTPGGTSVPAAAVAIQQSLNAIDSSIAQGLGVIERWTHPDYSAAA